MLLVDLSVYLSFEVS